MLLNVPGDIDHEALDNTPQCITKTSLDEIPTTAEMARAIAGLKDGKAIGAIGTREEHIIVDGNKLNSVLEFTYVGSTLPSNGCIDYDIKRRMAKADFRPTTPETLEQSPCVHAG